MFHRVDDWRKLPAPRFFRYAVRLPAYTGVLAARVAAEQQEERPSGEQPTTRRRRPGGAPAEVDPNLVGKLTGEGWIEHNKVKGE